MLIARRSESAMNEEISFTYIDSPVGRMMLVGNSQGLLEISFMAGRAPRAPDPRWHLDDSLFGDAIAQLRDYFNGNLREFDLRLHPVGTPFQLLVWQALREIPFGETISYAELARRIGKPRAVRAVGAANGKNPLSIVIPCHRVIGSDGSLTGYGGGMENKKYLLALEGSQTMALAGSANNANAKNLSANNANNR
jgi:methylated-DNA-[protein]-cysteine S-methyltransferase